MKIDDNRVDELAHLARLEFSDAQKNRIKQDLDRIIDFCDTLKEVNTEGVDPLVYVSEEYNVLREDKVSMPFDKELALKNAPSRDSDYFKVPKVITK